jgi:hypothetical protein
MHVDTDLSKKSVPSFYSTAWKAGHEIGNLLLNDDLLSGNNNSMTSPHTSSADDLLNPFLGNSSSSIASTTGASRSTLSAEDFK